MPNARNLARQRAVERIRRRDARARPSRYCGCCANRGGRNSDHFFCVVCRKVTAETRVCCGIAAVAVSCIARFPRLSASRRRWQEVIRRFVLPRLHRFSRGRDRGYGPEMIPPEWDRFAKVWGAQR